MNEYKKTSLMKDSPRFDKAVSPISLIWQADRKTSWEEDWILELLSGFNVETIDDGNYEKFSKNSIIIVSAMHNFSDSHLYLEKLHQKNDPFGVILLSDEKYKASTESYKYAKFVLRNYWHKRFLKYNNLIVFPLGYKSGFWKNRYSSIKEISYREYTWSFVGQVKDKPTRESMISAMKQIPSYFLHETFAWEDPQSLSVDEYKGILLKSTFVPCPRGWWNLDSFRVYEALECGCIPIVEKSPIDYFSHLFRHHPLIAIDSWHQAPDLINKFLSNPILLEQRRQKIYDWWKNYKKNIRSQISQLIHENLDI